MKGGQEELEGMKCGFTSSSKRIMCMYEIPIASFIGHTISLHRLLTFPYMFPFLLSLFLPI